MIHSESEGAPSEPAADTDSKSAATGENGASGTKKERVLHTRIPALLENELKAAAAALRIPVSNLVRTILEDAVNMADRATGHVESSLRSAARSVHDERERFLTRIKKADPLSHVIAYQPAIVAQATKCANCAVALEPGDDAALGVTKRPSSTIFVCTSCIPRRGAKP